MIELRPGDVGATPSVLAFVQRPRLRTLLRSAFPRRKYRLVFATSADECTIALTAELIDAVVVDLAAASEERWQVAALAREFPSAAFVGVAPLRIGDAAVLSAAAAHDLADVLVDGVDDATIAHLALRDGFSARFARALTEPPANLGLDTAVHRAVWSHLVSYAGRPLQTSEIAAGLRITREHLSRVFSANGSPNLKRVIDLVRLLAAAELAKNPGFGLREVATVLGFASPSHLSATAVRIAGTRSPSLARLRAVDLVGRFARGHARSHA